MHPNEFKKVKKYKTDNSYAETFGLKPIKDYRDKLVNLEFDFTSLHDFLNNTRFVLNQHAKILNDLRKNIITRCSQNDLSNFFVWMARSYPIENISNQMDKLSKAVINSESLATDSYLKKVKGSIPMQVGRQESFRSMSKNSMSSQKKSVSNSPKRGSPRKMLSIKEQLKENVENFNFCIKHIAEQLI